MSCGFPFAPVMPNNPVQTLTWGARTYGWKAGRPGSKSAARRWRCSLICTNCKRNNVANRAYCAACGKPLPGMGSDEYSSGTSAAVGPSFFVGQSVEIRPNGDFHETTAVLRRLGWVSLAAAALLVVAALEWQVWRPSTTDSAAVAPISAPNASHADSQASSSSTITTPTPPARRVTAQPATTTQAMTPVALVVRAIPLPAFTARKVESAHLETPDQRDADDSSGRVKLLRAEMKRGDTDAPVTLANMYLEGKDVSRSCDQALSLLESAAARKNARARNRLAALYEIGSCVQRDRVQAYRWLSAALEADRNNSWAQQNRDQTWREMTTEERTMAEADR